MTLAPRNAPCPCGSGNKYKKCCLRREAARVRPAAPERVVSTPGRTFAISREGAPDFSVDAHRWPVESAYVPAPDVWRATGLGTAAIARRSPDGRLAYAVFLLDLTKHGLKGAFGKIEDASPRDFLGDVREMIPPMVDGSVAEAAAFVYGAIAVSEAQRAAFPPGEIAQYLDLLPSPPGAAQQWLDGLAGRTPSGLARIIADLPADADVEQGKEIVVRTEMDFEIPDVENALARGSDRFTQIDSTRFHYTPIPVWKRSRHGTPGKVQGQVELHDNRLVAVALTLSMAARLVAHLRDWLGPEIALASVRWVNSVTGRRETATFDRVLTIASLEGQRTALAAGGER